MKYNYCLGIVLDGNYVEKTCKRRDNCRYYLEDIFTRFKPDELADEPLLNEAGMECCYYLPKRDIVEIAASDEPFAPITGK